MPLHHLDVFSRELSNGATVLVHSDLSAPVASVQIWVGTGSIHENDWLGSGVSHLLEHLMFKGTARRGNSAMAQEIQMLGGHLNAYTSFDRTVYYVDLPAENASSALSILADAVLHSTLPEHEFEKEKEVIRREFAMGDDSPERRLSKLMFRTAFTQHPYRFPVIGYLDLFNHLSRENVWDYYQERYTPQNLTVVVVGAVDPEQIFATAEAEIGSEPRRFLRDILILPEPKLSSPRKGWEGFPTTVTRLALMYPIPGIDHPDGTALDLLALVAGGGRSSRLFQACVEQSDLAEETDAFSFSGSGTGIWGVEGRCQPEKRDRLLARWEEEVRTLASVCVSEVELERVKRLSLLQQLHGLKTMSGQAGLIGRGWLLARDPNFEINYTNRLQSLTAEHLCEVAQRYLRDHPSIVTELAPLESVQSRTAAVVSGDTSAISTVTCSGLSIFAREDRRLPLLSLRAIFPGGPILEPEGKVGLSRLAAQLLIKGTRRRTSTQLAEDVESLGGTMESYSGINSGSLGIEVLSQQGEAGFELFRELLSEPCLRPEELETERRKQLSQIEVERDHPMAVARNLVRAILYPDHGYGRNALGTPETLASITAADVESFWYSCFYQRNTRLAVAGDWAASSLEVHFASVLEMFAGRPAPAAPHRRTRTLLSTVREEMTVPKSQAVLQVAFPSAPLNDLGQPALDLLSEALSDLGSRLFIRIREELGLAYFVGAAQFQGAEDGHFVFYLGTDPEKRRAVEAAFLDEIARIGEHGLEAVELERARAKVLSEAKIAAQQTMVTAFEAGLNDLLGLGSDYREKRLHRISTLSLEEVNATARAYIHAQPYALVVVSPS